MDLNGSPYDYIIHVALISISRASLITSFQPPLVSGHDLGKPPGASHLKATDYKTKTNFRLRLLTLMVDVTITAANWLLSLISAKKL